MKYLIAVIFIFSFAVKADNHYQLTNKYYDIDAENLVGLIKSIKTKGPIYSGRPVWALINWDLKTNFQFKTTDKGCQFSAYRIDVVAEMTLPNWTNATSQNRAVKKWWQEWSAFLQDHETQHYNNVKKGVELLSQNMAKMQPAVNCEVVKRNFLTLKHKALDQIEINDVKVDSLSKIILENNSSLNRVIKKYGDLPLH